MIGFQAAFLQQLLNIPQRQRISKIPADRTENERRFRLPPLEHRRSRSHFTILSPCQPGPAEVATQPVFRLHAPFLKSNACQSRKSVSKTGRNRRSLRGLTRESHLDSWSRKRPRSVTRKDNPLGRGVGISRCVPPVGSADPAIYSEMREYRQQFTPARQHAPARRIRS